MYIWSLAMRRNFLRYLEIIVEKTNVLLLALGMITSSLRSLKSLFFIKKLKDFFHLFLGTTFENTSR